MRILLVEDEPELASATSRLMEHWGYSVTVASLGQVALDAMGVLHPDVVMLDIGLPDFSGLDLISRIKALEPDCTVIMLTGQNDPRLAVQAVRQGAEDYLTKPVHPDELRLVLDRAGETARQRREVESLRQKAEHGYLYLQHPLMREVYSSVAKVAASDKASVLILGETGSGKQPIARLIHQLSPRSGGPFQELHCAALPETLLESELFGYEAGAFTDARRPKPGLMELAQGGTLFLDEVGELPLSMQIKLLKVLEDRQVRRLGSTRVRDLDLRLVAATNRDLDAEVAAGRFRSDLLYRLKVFTVALPPLRGRHEDIEALARYFYAQFSQEAGRRSEQLPADVLEALDAYAWPGNVRELRNVMERFVIQQGDGRPGLASLPLELRETPVAPAAPSHASAPVAKSDGLRALLEKHRWNKSKAAAEMGVSRPTFLKRLKEAGIE